MRRRRLIADRQILRRFVVVVILGCLISAAIQVAGQLALGRLWWGPAFSQFGDPVEHVSGYSRLLAYALFPTTAALTGCFAGLFLRRPLWPVLLMLWPLWLSIGVFYLEEFLRPTALSAAYAAIALLCAHLVHQLARSRYELKCV